MYTKGFVWKKPQAGEKPESGLESVNESEHLKRPDKGKPSGTRRKGQRTLVKGLVFFSALGLKKYFRQEASE